MRVAIKLNVAVLLVLALAAGCGQNGPLYLPGDASSIRIEQPAQDSTQPAAQESDKKKDEDKQ